MSGLNRPLTLCFVADATSIHVQRWLQFFADRGHRVFCLSDKPQELPGITMHPLPVWENTPKTKKKSGLKRMKRAKEKGLQIKSSIIKSVVIEARAYQIRELLQEIQPDVVHAHFVYYRGWPTALAGFSPLMITLYGSDVHVPKADSKDQFLSRLLNGLAMLTADVITGVSADLCRIARRQVLNQVPVEMIPIGIDPTLFTPLKDTNRVRTLKSQLEIPPDAFVVLSPRQMTPLYNLEILIDSIPQVLAVVPHAVFILKDAFCNTEERRQYVAELKTRVASLKVSHAVRWVEELPYTDLPVLYSLADCMVSIPRTDGMPVTLFEAMACETPVIVGNLATYDDIVLEGKTGYRLPQTSPEALAETLIRIAKDPKAASHIAKAAQKIVEQYGLFDQQMLRVEALYRKLSEDKACHRQGFRKRLSRAFLGATLRCIPDPLFVFDRPTHGLIPLENTVRTPSEREPQPSGTPE
jgi:glycosyltransferase involved in cell wall biosynthesis